MGPTTNNCGPRSFGSSNVQFIVPVPKTRRLVLARADNATYGRGDRSLVTAHKGHTNTPGYNINRKRLSTPSSRSYTLIRVKCTGNIISARNLRLYTRARIIFVGMNQLCTYDRPIYDIYITYKSVHIAE